MTGKWTGLLKTDQGEEYSLLYNFKIDGDTLTGTAKTPKGILPIYDGKITGDSFTFDVLINHLEIDHSGKFYGDSFTFDVVINHLEIDHNGKFYGDSVGVDISLGDQKAHATLKRAD